MPDIFGRERSDYEHIRAIDEAAGEDAWRNHAEVGARLLRAEGGQDIRPEHNFDSLGRGQLDDVTRAPSDATGLGFITSTGLQLMTMVDEIYYTNNRLDQFVALNTEIAEGAQSYGVRIIDVVGKMDRVSSPGHDAPTATVARTIAQAELQYYGVDFEYSLQDLRQAAYQGIPLQAEDMKAVMAVAMDAMEQVAFTGGGYPGARGLFNLSTTGSQSVTSKTADQAFADSGPVEIRNLINAELSDVISRSKEVIGRSPRLMDGMTVYLPQAQYDLLTTMYIGDNADRTLMRSILDDNPWTHFSSRPLSIQRVLELDSIGGNSRMVVALKNTNVAELPLAFAPRLIRILDQGRNIRGQIEARFGELQVKRPSTITYVNGV